MAKRQGRNFYEGSCQDRKGREKESEREGERERERERDMLIEMQTVKERKGGRKRVKGRC